MRKAIIPTQQLKAIGKTKTRSKQITADDVVKCARVMIDDIEIDLALNPNLPDDILTHTTITKTDSNILLVSSSDEFVLTISYKILSKGGLL